MHCKSPPAIVSVPSSTPSEYPRIWHPGWIAAAACLALRLWSLGVFFSSSSPVTESGDAHYYVDWAGRIANGTWTDGQAFYGLPFYAYWLAAILKLSGGNTFFPLLVQIFADSAISFLAADLVLLIFASQSRINVVFDTTLISESSREAQAAGLVAGLGWALFPSAQALAVSFMPTTLGILCFWLIVRWTLTLRQRPRLGAAFLVGVGIGIASTLVANLLFLLPLVALRCWLAVGTHVSKWKPAGAMLAVVGGVVVGTGPVWMHNYLVAHEPVILSSHGGINFYVGNQPDATGYPKMPPGMRASQAGMLEDSKRLAEAAEGRTLTRAEAGGYWSRQATTAIMTDPAAWIRLLLRKIRNYWNVFQYDDVALVENLREEGVIAPGPRFGWIAALGLAGLVAACRFFPAARWVAAAVVLHLLSLLPVFVTERYRMVAVPGLLAGAGVGLVWCWRMASAQRWRPLLTWYLLPLVAAVVLVTLPTRDPKLWALNRYHAGKSLLEHGHPVEADAEAARALAYAPLNAEINFLVANSRLALGDRAQAKEYYRRTLSLDPLHARAWNNAGVVALEEKNWEVAERLLTRATEIQPQNAKTFFLLARASQGRADFARALSTVQKALALDPARLEYQELRTQLQSQLNANPVALPPHE